MFVLKTALNKKIFAIIGKIYMAISEKNTQDITIPFWLTGYKLKTVFFNFIIHLISNV